MSTTATFGARDAESLTGSAQDLGKTARGFFCGTNRCEKCLGIVHMMICWQH